MSSCKRFGFSLRIASKITKTGQLLTGVLDVRGAEVLQHHHSTGSRRRLKTPTTCKRLFNGLRPRTVCGMLVVFSLLSLFSPRLQFDSFSTSLYLFFFFCTESVQEHYCGCFLNGVMFGSSSSTLFVLSRCP